MQEINGVISESVSLDFIEEKSEVDGQYIIGKVKGPFFFPDGISRNQRFYPKALWEKTISDPDTIEKMQNRNMYGTIGHDTKITDKAFAEGKLSHIVTKLYIDENGQGMGEALILNTESGKNLNTLARAGCKLFVSSRATGQYENYKHKGMPVVSKDHYRFQGFDFVIDAGFEKASPDLKEALNNINNINKKENTMDSKLLESLTNENSDIKKKLSEKAQEIKNLEGEKAVLESKTKELNETLKKFEGVEDVKALKESVQKLAESQDIIERYSEICSVESIDETKNTIEALKNFGSIEDIEKVADIAEEFQEIGDSPAQINKALDYCEEKIKKFDDLGTVADVIESVEIAEKLLQEKEDLKIKEEIEKLAEDLGVPKTAIAKVYGKISNGDIREMFKEMRGDDSSKYKKSKKSEEESEEEEEKDVVKESRASRLFEALM